MASKIYFFKDDKLILRIFRYTLFLSVCSRKKKKNSNEIWNIELKKCMCFEGKIKFYVPVATKDKAPLLDPRMDQGVKRCLTMFNNNSNNNDFIATYINRWTWPIYSVQAGSHNRILLQWTTLASPFNRKTRSKIKVPLIATCHSNRRIRNRAKTHTDLLHARNYSFNAARYISSYVSLSLSQIFLTSSLSSSSF